MAGRRISLPTYDAKGGGILRQNGPRFERSRNKSRSIQKLIGADRRSIPYDELGQKRETEVPEYEEGKTYTKRQLTLMAECLLRDQHQTTLDAHEAPAILLFPMLKDRLKREIYVGNGIPDPSVESGLYWRTHPEGRSFRTPLERKALGASFYK